MKCPDCGRDHADGPEWVACRVKLRAERDRYKDALEDIASTLGSGWAQDIATKALELPEKQ